MTSSMLLDAADTVPRTNAKAMKPRFGQLPVTAVMLVLIGFCMFLSEGAMADWTAVYMKQSLFAGPGEAAAGYAVFSGGMALFRLMGDVVTKKLGPVLTARIGALTAAFGLTVALLARTPGWAFPGLALAGAGFSVIVPLVFAAGGRVKGLPRGAAVALVSGSGYIGFLFGPPIIGYLSQWLTLRGALFFVVALCVLSATRANAVSAGEET